MFALLQLIALLIDMGCVRPGRELERLLWKAVLLSNKGRHLLCVCVCVCVCVH